MGKLLYPLPLWVQVYPPPPLPGCFYNCCLTPPLTKDHCHLVLMCLISLLPTLQTTFVPLLTAWHLTYLTHTSPALDEACMRQSPSYYTWRPTPFRAINTFTSTPPVALPVPVTWPTTSPTGHSQGQKTSSAQQHVLCAISHMLCAYSSLRGRKGPGTLVHLRPG